MIKLVGYKGWRMGGVVKHSNMCRDCIYLLLNILNRHPHPEISQPLSSSKYTNHGKIGETEGRLNKYNLVIAMPSCRVMHHIFLWCLQEKVYFSQLIYNFFQNFTSTYILYKKYKTKGIAGLYCNITPFLTYIGWF